MVKKNIIIGVMLSQVLVVFGSENSLRKSSSDLRKSSDKVPSRSCSRELTKQTATRLVADMYYDSPCGERIIGKAYSYNNSIKPYPYLPGEFPGM